MVRLTAKDDWQNGKWYFKNMEDCEAFKAVFRDHHCNIEWNPVEVTDRLFPGQPADRYTGVHKDPKERALADLSWGFNSYMAEHGGVNTITADQQSFIDRIAKMVVQEDPEPSEEDIVDYDDLKKGDTHGIRKDEMS